MNIVLAASIFSPDIGGPATYTAQLAESLTKRGHTVRVICFSDSTQKRPAGYEVIRIKRSRFKPWSHWNYLRALANVSKGMDCIYTQGPTAAGWQARKVAQGLKIPYVVKIVGDYAWEQGRVRFGLDCSIEEFQVLPKLPAVVGRLKALQQLVVKDAQQIIVPSQYLANLVQNWGVSEDKIKVINNSFTPSVQSQEVSQKQENVFFTGGRLVPWKGFDTLIKLWPQVVKQIPTARLEIAGDGPDEVRLRQLIQTVGVQTSVALLGRLTSAEMAQHYAQATAFILNSDYEGMSHMILEAMSAGTISLVSRRGGNEELVQAGQTGWLFEYNNSADILATVLRLAQSPLDSALIARLKQKSQEFSPDLMLTQTEGVLLAVIKTSAHV